jgi:polyhydroxybutyrate depolymerase
MGGGLMYQLACNMSEIFAAIASVSGYLEDDTCQPSKAVSVLHVHGLANTIVSYSGEAEQGITTWVQLNDCTGSAQVEELCQTFVDQIHMKLDDCTEEKPTNTVTHTTHGSCQAGTAVESYTIASGRHLWPSNYVPPFSEMIWEFFATQPKP